ncbi:hypothetical protein H0H93_000248 [Arthromyces matolae]|nr:hypothetical protein H0H93_000248 [Arthromyces matolae]
MNPQPFQPNFPLLAPRNKESLYGLLIGKGIAKAVLAHHDRGCYVTHYSRNTANLDPVALVLGEKQATYGSALNVDKHNVLASFAVEAIVRREKAFLQVPDMNEKERIHAEADAVPEVMEVINQWDAAWESFYACFTSSAVNFPPVTENIDKIYGRGTGKVKVTWEYKPLIHPKEAWTRKYGSSCPRHVKEAK